VASLVLEGDPCSCLNIQFENKRHCLTLATSRIFIILNTFAVNTMPRKTTKDASASAPRSSSKRPAQDTPSRQSKRARATARKSYAEPETDEDDGVVKKHSMATDEDDVSEASGLEQPSDADPTSESEEEEASDDEPVQNKKPKSRGKAVQKTLPLHRKQADEKELWKSGAKLAPGTQLIIKKPKAREAGDTPYTDETVHPNTMMFLKDLAANNERQWLKCKSTTLPVMRELQLRYR
jgi:hypothetical protein